MVEGFELLVQKLVSPALECTVAAGRGKISDISSGCRRLRLWHQAPQAWFWSLTSYFPKKALRNSLTCFLQESHLAAWANYICSSQSAVRPRPCRLITGSRLGSRREQEWRRRCDGESLMHHMQQKRSPAKTEQHGNVHRSWSHGSPPTGAFRPLSPRC